MRLVAENEDRHQLEQSLCSTIHHIITETKEDLFEPYDDNSSSNYLTVQDFIEFVLVPFVAISLIEERMPGYNPDSGFQDAIFERNNSNEFGDIFHAEEDDPKADQIHQENIAAIRAFKRIPNVPEVDEVDEEEAEMKPPHSSEIPADENDEESETAPPRHRKVSIKKDTLKVSAIIMDCVRAVLEQFKYRSVFHHHNLSSRRKSHWMISPLYVVTSTSFTLLTFAAQEKNSCKEKSAAEAEATEEAEEAGELHYPRRSHPFLI